MTQGQVVVTNPARHIVPAYFNWLSENDQRVHVTFAVDVTTVSMKPWPRKDLFNEVSIQMNGELYKVTTLTLNTNPEAVNGFRLNDDGFFFNCRIATRAIEVFIPFESVIMLECQNIGLKQVFGVDPSLFKVKQADKAKQETTVKPEVPRARPTLVRVK